MDFVRQDYINLAYVAAGVLFILAHLLYRWFLAPRQK